MTTGDWQEIATMPINAVAVVWDRDGPTIAKCLELDLWVETSKQGSWRFDEGGSPRYCWPTWWIAFPPES